MLYACYMHDVYSMMLIHITAYTRYTHIYTCLNQIGECLPEVRALQWLNLKQCELGPVGGQVGIRISVIYHHVLMLRIYIYTLILQSYVYLYLCISYFIIYTPIQRLLQGLEKNKSIIYLDLSDNHLTGYFTPTSLPEHSWSVQCLPTMTALGGVLILNTTLECLDLQSNW